MGGLARHITIGIEEVQIVVYLTKELSKSWAYETRF